jgi:probable HAF family extracellular repeat protein
MDSHIELRTRTITAHRLYTILGSLCVLIARTLFVTVLGFFIVAAAVCPASAQARYKVEDLGTLGGTFAQPNTLNNRSQVTGISGLPGDEVAHAFFWDKGTMIDLGTLGGPISVGNGINNTGEVVVGADTDVPGGLQNTICATSLICRMFIWRNGIEVPDLGTLPGGTDAGTYSFLGFGFATSLINDNHKAIGTADLPITDPNNPPFAVFHAFRWSKGEIEDLGTLGGFDSQAVAINNRGDVIGGSQTTTAPDPELGFPPSHCFLWRRGKMSDVGTLGGTLSWPGGINDRGQVAGVSLLGGDVEFHGFLWQDGAFTDLRPFHGDAASAGSGINNNGDVVGASGSLDQAIRAVLWKDGKVIDLNNRIPADSGWVLIWAGSINARGQITGFGVHNDEGRAFLLTPTDDSTGIAQSASPAARIPQSAAPLPDSLRRLLRWGPGQMHRQQ